MRRFILSMFVFCMTCIPLIMADFVGKCVGVSDGDTISVMKGDKAIKIRIDGVDCPETSQDFGAKAKTFTSEMVFGKDVEVKEKGLDKYGRTVGSVFVEGKNLNLELLKAGLAWHYKQYSKDEAYSEAEKKARENMLGLWGGNNPVPPWDFRNGKTEQPTSEITISQTETKKDVAEEIVYITKTGAKYHRAGCKYLRKSSIPIKLRDAVLKYSPCSVCKPPVLSEN